METDRTLIVVPTFNERENIGALLPKLLQIAPDSDVLLIDDNSPDGTANYAQEMFGTDRRVSVLKRSGPRSFGHSLLDGFRVGFERGYAQLVQMDADFSHDPNEVPVLINATREADLVIGSRYCQGGRVANWPLHRRLLSRFANQYVGSIIAVNVRDCTSGFRCWTRHAVQCLLKIGVTSEGYAFQIEAVFRAQRERLRIVEVPITFTDRRAGQSKMSGKVILEAMLKPWLLRFRK
jgi:dolichol-phosphate mannosyltransferase